MCIIIVGSICQPEGVCGVYRWSIYPVNGSWCVGDELGWGKVALLAAYNLEIRFWSMGCHSGRVVDGFYEI